MSGWARVSRNLAIIAVSMGFAASAQASNLTPDFNSFGTSHSALPHDGDFDGDGRRDALYMVNEPDTGRVAVHIRLNTTGGAQDIRVTSFDLAAGAKPDLQVVPAGQYTLDCGDYATDCTAHTVETGADSLVLGMNGITVLMHWNGTRFDQDFVRADDTAPWGQLARALSALYAANR